MKKVLFHGVVASGLAAIAAITYSKVYLLATGADFSKVVNAGSITGASFIAALLASLAYYFFIKKVKKNPDVWFNLLFTLMTFASFLGPVWISLPLDIRSPELFMGLTIPIQLFPQLFWLTTKPLFTYEP